MTSTSDAARWAQIKALFDAVADEPPAQREALISAAGLDDGALAELRSLLAHHDAAATGVGAFMATDARTALAETPAPAVQPGQRLGAWEVVRALGSGGMGEVFEARRADGSYEGRAAVKLLKRGMDSAAVLQRFAQERQALARLSHPHIARLLDAGASEQGLPYFVLEYVDGQPVDAAVQGLVLEARLQLFLQLADAVAHAHRNLLVHRDLKPGNVLVDREGQVKLLDFGIAKALDPLEGRPGEDLAHLTVGGVRPYTPQYASPEQVRGEPVSTATDIYSLGVLLYLMLTGTRPTGRRATTPAEAARCVLEDEPTRPSRLSPDDSVDPRWLATRKRLAGDLDNILLKALEKAPERRYASVDAFAADVRAVLQGRPVSARPASPAYVLGKFVRRNRWAVLAGSLGGLGAASGLAAALLQGRQAAALGVVGLAGGLGLALFQSRQAALARDEARRQLVGVKNIATELVFRYGDAIQQIPGGANAQEAMLRQTVDSLELTLAQSPEDIDLNVLMASALGRLAQIQGNPTFAGPERAAEAAATVQRARRLAEKVWAARRGDARFVSQHLITLLTQANMLRNQDRVADGLAVLETAHQRAAEALAERLPTAGRADLQELQANVLTNLAHFSDHSGRPSLGRPQDALRHYAAAQAAFEALYGNAELVAAMNAATDPGSPATAEWANHNIANTLIGRALVHQRLGDHAAMRADAEASIVRRLDNLRRNPTSAIWRQGLMFDSNYLALALLQQGEPAAALVASQRAWDIVAQRLQEEGPQPIWLSARGNFAAQHARALASLGRHAEARPVFELALARARAIQVETPGAAADERLATLRADAARSAGLLHADAGATP
ncbi:MAG: serine/threonine-protein kinase [Rubrivivax sp.]|nr:serine/threonine-protein kinase [Rubrivivax sp.]